MHGQGPVLYDNDEKRLRANRTPCATRNQPNIPSLRKPELGGHRGEPSPGLALARLKSRPTTLELLLPHVLPSTASSAATWSAGWSAERDDAALAHADRADLPQARHRAAEVLTLHSDRGAPMTSKCTAQTVFADLGVTRSLSRLELSPTTPSPARSSVEDQVGKYHPIRFPAKRRYPSPPSPYVGAGRRLPLVQHRAHPPWRNRQSSPPDRRCTSAAPAHRGRQHRRDPAPQTPRPSSILNASFDGIHHPCPFGRSGLVRRHLPNATTNSASSLSGLIELLNAHGPVALERAIASALQSDAAYLGGVRHRASSRSERHHRPAAQRIRQAPTARACPARRPAAAHPLGAPPRPRRLRPPARRIRLQRRRYTPRRQQ